MAKEKKTLTAAAIKRFPAAPSGKRVEHFDAAMPGFALRVTDKGEKSFVLFSRIGGKQVRLTIGKAQLEEDGPGVTLADARQTARDWITLCAKGEHPREKKGEGGTLGLATPAAAPVETYTVRMAVAAYEKAHISRLKPRSQLEARRPLKKILLAKWPDRALSDVSKADLREVLSGMVESGNPVAANRALANLKAFFNWCLAEDRLTVNPCIGIRDPGGNETSRDRVLSDEEIRTLWPILEETSYPFGSLAQFLLVTAQRRDEGANLRWSEITDLEGDNPVWTIPAAKNKGGRLHEVPLSPLAVRLLRSLPRIAVETEADKPMLSDFVFTTTGKGPVSGFSDGKERMDKLTVREFKRIEHETGKAPAPLARWTLHDLRRTAASGMARDDIPPHVVSRVLNHSPGKAEGITAVYNRHGYLREKRHALEAWAGKLEILIRPVGANVVRLRG
ncbi:putative Site-specific recombinase XerD [Magnetospirillum sp. LM-5]|uniref:tyrosine-type recombinase/integrase n=1 Tax=Magnetospirillum sp. LM-5 TaxID=2681466 RepID=UPI00137ED1A1|nr:site-specific integrase [Magnetospirillum sp. LM-5]CAA7613316.1 putative Site-specific recombinase XerD [Magnetospirillum sp. LM-5]